jgi:hypothetical protein
METRNNKDQSLLASLVLRTYLRTKGKRMIKPIKCSKNIMVMGGSEYKCLLTTPSKAHSSAAMIIRIGPENARFFNIDGDLFLFGL